LKQKRKLKNIILPSTVVAEKKLHCAMKPTDFEKIVEREKKCEHAILNGFSSRYIRP
jgi:hypothetical protein